MCTVTGLESLNATTNFVWRDDYWNLVSSNAVLTFSPLLSYHEGGYYCIADVSTPFLVNDFDYNEHIYLRVRGRFTRKHG